jgi:hypothetical protein
MNEKAVGRAFLIKVGDRLDGCQERIKHCLAQLDDSQVWWRAHDSLNSIGNLVLHLCGNIRQWLVVGIQGGADSRDRPQEFAERTHVPKGGLIQRLDAVIHDAKLALATLSDEQLL